MDSISQSNHKESDAEKYYSRPVVPLVLSVMFGIALGAMAPGYRHWAFVCIILCVFLVSRNIIRKKISLFFPALLFFCLGYISILPFVSPEFPANHIINFTDKQKWKITGIVETRPIVKNRRAKFLLEVKSLADDDKFLDVNGKVRVTVALKEHDFVSGLALGDKISFSSRIRSIRNFSNPGGFNYKRYMSFKGVHGTAYTKEARLSLVKKGFKKGLFSTIESARDGISLLIDQTNRGESRHVLKALITGDRSQITPTLRDAFNRAGVGHLLAISGLHIGIVATVSFMLFSWILSYIKFFLWQGWVKKGAAILSLFPVLAYGMIAGMSPSTQRAVIMVFMFLMTFLFEREQDSLNTLAIAAMAILMVSPPSLFSISFQLSFSAVLAIICGISKLRNKTEPGSQKENRSYARSLAGKLFTFLSVSFFAIMGTLPLVLYYFNQVSLVGLLTNLIFVPLIGFVVVPLSLCAVFIYPLSLQAAIFLIKAGGFILAKTLISLHFISGFPFVALKTVTPSLFEIACFYTGIAAVFNLNSPLALRRKQAKVVALVVIILFVADIFFWLEKRVWHDDLRVTVIDVGQGTSALLELPGGQCMLIDGGGFSDNRVFDVGKSIIAPFLWRKKIRTVDTLVLSHPNSDHLNGLIYIAQNFNVKNVWSNYEAVNTMAYQKFMEVIEEKDIDMPNFKVMPRSFDISGVLFTVLYPPADFIDKKKMETWRNTNNNSVVLKARFGSQSFLFPGDIMAKGEKELVALAGNTLKSTVLIAPHHGSKTSSTKGLLDSVQPQAVVISSGWKGRFGFPHKSVLKKYNKRGCEVFRTDIKGAIMMETDGDVLKIRATID